MANFLYDIEKQEAMTNASGVLKGFLGIESKKDIREKNSKNMMMLGIGAAVLIMLLMFKRK
jgi:hypothetical protein